jgi:putative ABC transport system ATP-binding protein
MTRQTVVTGRGLKKRYGSGPAAVDALRGVDLDVAAGTFTAIMGPSGSGKSTLMHLLAGLDKPSEGTVTIDGVELKTLDDAGLTRLRRDKIGFVFQAFNLVPVLTAEENVALPLTLAGLEPGDKVERVLDAVRLLDRRGHRPSELSGGQQQRVAIARAIVGGPAVVFADEPTGNLDSATSNEVLRLLREAVDAQGQAIVMVTHDPGAAAVADRVVFLADGLTVADEAGLSAEDVLDRMRGLVT